MGVHPCRNRRRGRRAAAFGVAALGAFVASACGSGVAAVRTVPTARSLTPATAPTSTAAPSTSAAPSTAVPSSTSSTSAAPDPTVPFTLPVTVAPVTVPGDSGPGDTGPGDTGLGATSGTGDGLHPDRDALTTALPPTSAFAALKRGKLRSADGIDVPTSFDVTLCGGDQRTVSIDTASTVTRDVTTAKGGLVADVTVYVAATEADAVSAIGLSRRQLEPCSSAPIEASVIDEHGSGSAACDDAVAFQATQISTAGSICRVSNLFVTVVVFGTALDPDAATPHPITDVEVLAVRESVGAALRSFVDATAA